MLRSNPINIGLTAVTSKNLIAVNQDQSIFDRKKRIKAATVESMDTKLNYSQSQRSASAFNNALLVTAQMDLFSVQVKHFLSRK